MLFQRLARAVRALLFILFAGVVFEVALTETADARAGGRRSFGKSNNRPTPAQQYRQNNNPPPQAAPSQRGNFMRGLAGGIAGGVLGSMLFSSLAHGSTGGLGGSGIGMIEILLMGLAAFFLFRWWKSRQQPAAAGANNFMRGGMSPNMNQAPYTVTQPTLESNNQSAYAPLDQASARISEDDASDLFFRVQGAFTRRDLEPIRSYLSADAYENLNRDIQDLKNQGRINKLENISVRRVDVIDSWQEAGIDFVRVRFTANLLDYLVDEKSGQVLDGNAYEPVKFEEDWVLSRTGGLWQLAGIQQLGFN